MKVHILINGHPACGFTSDLPHHWPADHKWVGADEAHMSNCQGCISQLHNQDELEVRQS